MDLRQQQTTAARHLLDQLTADQVALARLPVDSGDRERWTYLPGDRHGLGLAGLDRPASVAVLRLLATGLSAPAFAQAAAVMALEDVLEEIERRGRDRHRGDYWVAVYGDPGEPVWGWRVEGHHLSVNVTWVDDEPVRSTPLFLGANPARTESAGLVVLEPLAPEEQLGFELVGALDGDALDRAVISDTAPDDIVTGDSSRVSGQPQPTGVPVDRLDGRARRLADELVALHLGRLPHGATPPPVDGLAFAWAGAREPGGPHYYRLQGSRLLVELDNTQDGANHVHSVVRDLEGDFGGDVLRRHLQRDHGR
jgi:hypothetical protein